MQLLADIACNHEILPKLTHIVFNTGDLFFTSYRPTRDQLTHFEQLFDLIKTREMNSLRKIYFNHLHVNPAGPVWQATQFDDLHLDRPLVSLHFTQNERKALSGTLAYTVEYLDVLDCFSKLQGDNEISFWQFEIQYPQIQVVRICNATRKAELSASLFILFLSVFDGLQKLALNGTGFGYCDFYWHLYFIRSSSTLHTLEVFEPPGKFNQPIDFKFLSSWFPSLRRFVTNVPNRVFFLVSEMLFDSCFEFRYWNSSLDKGLFEQVKVKHCIDGKYKVTKTTADQRTTRTVFESLNEILLHLQEPGFIPKHWLDSTLDVQS